MKKKKRNGMPSPLVAASVVVGAAAGAIAILSGRKLSDEIEEKAQREQWEMATRIAKNRRNQDAHVYFVGGGLASLAGAAYLIRDCHFKGENIHIIEGLKVLGGSNDGAGEAISGFVCRGGRMLNEETYENFWELMSSIPSLEMPGMSVTEEILNFDHLHPTHAKARLIDKRGVIQDVKSMGFNQADRMALAKLMATPEYKLDDMTIEQWLKTHLTFLPQIFGICGRRPLLFRSGLACLSLNVIWSV